VRVARFWQQATDMSRSALIVSSDSSHAGALEVELARLGYATRHTGTAETAFAAITEQRPDVVIVSLVLPRMGGLLFAARLRSDRQVREVIRIAMTPLASSAVRDVAREAGFLDCLDETQPPGQLAAAIDAAFKEGTV